MSSSPLSRQWRRKGSTSNFSESPWPSDSVHASRSAVSSYGRVLGRPLEQIFDLRFAQPDRQHAVLEAVVVEDVGEAGGDDDAKAVVLERPGGVLAAGAAAEIPPGQEHGRALGGGLVELEVRVRRAVVALRPVPEQKLAEAGALDPLEELLGDDLVGVDVGPIEGDDFAGVFGEGFHGSDWNLLGVEESDKPRITRIGANKENAK